LELLYTYHNSILISKKQAQYLTHLLQTIDLKYSLDFKMLLENYEYTVTEKLKERYYPCFLDALCDPNSEMLFHNLILGIVKELSI